MTYLELVNDVLARLREDSVATFDTNDYSALIGKYINDAKRQVEDAWNWDALATTITLSTSAGTSTYTATGAGLNPRAAVINDTTNRVQLINMPINWITDQQQLTTVTSAIPCYYAWNGSDGTDKNIELFPTPNGTYSLKINCYRAQDDLSADGDVLLVPYQSVIAGAFARALVERGEDGGLNSAEAYNLFKNILADQIAQESGQFIENDVWVAC